MDRIKRFFRSLSIENLRRLPQRRVYKRTTQFLHRRPLTSFFIALAVLLGIIILGNTLDSLNKPKEETPEIVKVVEVYTINGTPSITVQAKVQKAGVIKIVAQTPGIVSAINFKEGEKIARGQSLLQLSSNYQGANAPALQAQLAQKQYENVKNTYDLQKDIISKQRDIADKTEANAEELRRIAADSANDTRSLIDLNTNIINTINENLQTLRKRM